MRWRPAIAALLVTLWSASAVAQSCDSGDQVIADPQALIWDYVPAGGDVAEPHWSASLEIGLENLCVGGETVTTRVYRVPGTTGTIPGPTITMNPGEKYVLQFTNALPYDQPDPEHNTFKDPNISNLHTHGLHISGESPGDDVTRSFEGGAGGDFVYDIPADHMGGTYWYHAHHHGSTFLQVSAGAFGMLLIDDNTDPDVPQNVRDMDERRLVIGYLDPAVAGVGGDTLISGTLSPTWTVNGKVIGDLEMPLDTWQHWRILLADRDAKLKTVTIGANCEAALMARDGVWRRQVPKILTDNAIELTGASRADLAVRCIGNSDIKVGTETVANIVVGGAASGQGHPFADGGEELQMTWTSHRPWYLRDLRNEVPGNNESINLGARSVMGSKFNAAVPNLELFPDAIQEWTLKGANNHPFHLHVYHVQVQGDCGPFEDGEYYDVVAGNCTVRFDLDASAPEASVYFGRTVMHCHILEHEDQGAMGWLKVLSGANVIPPPMFPSTAYAEYYPPVISGQPPAAPANLVAAAASSSVIDLTWADNSADEDGFDIERIEGGINAVQFSVGTDVISYSDTGLTAGTEYTYRVRAYNADGNSGWSDPAVATTQSSGQPTTVVVASVTVSTYSEKGTKYGRADVLIHDDIGNPVAGATVVGEFTGDLETSSLSETTGADGRAAITATEPIAGKGKVSLTFCVTSVSHPDLQDLNGVEVCGSL